MTRPPKPLVLTLYIRTENAAFDPAPTFELARILRELATRLEDMEDFEHWTTIRDINGNDVGRVRLAP